MKSILILALLVSSFFISSMTASAVDSRVDAHTMLLLTFDEGKGDTATDLSGNENHGKLKGAKWGVGKDGQGVVFKAGDSIIMPLSKTLDLTEHLTIEAWVNPAQVATRSDPICKHEGGAYCLIIDAGGNVRASFHIAGAYVAAKSGITVQSGKWYYIAGTYDGKALKVYINGKLEKETAVKGAVTSTNPKNTPLVLGGNPTAGGIITSNFFSGIIDEFRVSDIARTPNEIKAAMDPVKPVHPKGKLAATWGGIKSEYEPSPSF